MDDQTKAGAGKGTKTQRSTTTEAGTSRVDLKIPGRPDYVVVVRLTAAAVAGRMGLSYDDIEDLKVAVGGACSPAILTGAPTVSGSFLIASDRLEVQIAHRPAKGARAQETELNRVLMQGLMDEVDTRADAAAQGTRVGKRMAR